MNRIKEIVIIESAHRSPFVVFRDEIDVKHNLAGRPYQPSYSLLEMLRRVIRDMSADFDFRAGKVVLRHR